MRRAASPTTCAAGCLVPRAPTSTPIATPWVTWSTTGRASWRASGTPCANSRRWCRHPGGGRRAWPCSARPSPAGIGTRARCSPRSFPGRTGGRRHGSAASGPWPGASTKSRGCPCRRTTAPASCAGASIMSRRLRGPGQRDGCAPARWPACCWRGSWRAGPSSLTRPTLREPSCGCPWSAAGRRSCSSCSACRRPFSPGWCRPKEPSAAWRVTACRGFRCASAPAISRPFLTPPARSTPAPRT